MNSNPDEKLIKGSMLTFVVKAIRGAKDIPWDDYLTSQAKDLISQQILPSNWYPYDSSMSCIHAVYKLIGGGNPDMAAEWGRINGRQMFDSIYKNLILQGQTEQTLLQLNIISRKTLSRGLNFEFKKIEDTHYQINFIESDQRAEPICYLFKGYIEVLIEMSGGKNGSVEIIEKNWEGAKATVFDIAWE